MTIEPSRHLPPVYPISPDDRDTESLLGWCRELLDAGCIFFQHRRKRLPSGARLAELEQILRLAEPYGAKVIANDRPDLCLYAGAHGVHLGQEDLPPEAARRFLGRGRIIGFSAHGFDQAELARELPVNYIALGPVFPTGTKSDASPVLSEDEQRRILTSAALPVVAIGGVTIERAPLLWQRGFASVAAIAAFAEKPGEAFKKMREANSL